MPRQKYNLHLKGYVGGWDFNRYDVDELLERMDEKEVHVLIDSTGGQLSTALSISSAFSRHGNVFVHFTGMNASAATVASMGAKHISIDRSAMYLVHKGSLAVFEWSSLNADELQAKIEEFSKMKADLDKIDLNIAALYASRCKKKPEDVLELMREGAWLTAEEALEWGFVDEITDYEEDSPAQLSESQAVAFSNAGIPLPNMTVIPDAAFPVLSRLEGFLSGLFFGKKHKANGKAPGAEAAGGDTEAMERLQGQLAEKDSRIAELEQEAATLKARVQELEAEPADVSSSVIDEPSKEPSPSQELSRFEQHRKAAAAARAYFDSIK